MSEENNKTNNAGMSRRNFLKNSGLVAGGVVGGSLFGGLITNQFSKDNKNEDTSNETPVTFEARTFFNRNEDFAVLSAATVRIFPENDNGPGAIELGVPYFIDRQCAGDWGKNAHDYMQGPFPVIEVTENYEENKKSVDKVTPGTVVTVPSNTPRYQTKMTRGVLFLEGIRAMEKQSQDKFDEGFAQLEAEQQDEILQLFEAGGIDVSGVDSAQFFGLLRQTVIEGVYADPVYGGNRNMDGWRMKGFPGPRMAYYDQIDAEDFIEMEPEPLRAYQGN